MADYYSLLSRAVANLPKTSPPSARKAIYDRARKALNNQLRSLKPPLPESDIFREESALEAAILRLEAEIEPRSIVVTTGGSIGSVEAAPTGVHASSGEQTTRELRPLLKPTISPARAVSSEEKRAKAPARYEPGSGPTIQSSQPLEDSGGSRPPALEASLAVPRKNEIGGTSEVSEGGIEQVAAPTFSKSASADASATTESVLLLGVTATKDHDATRPVARGTEVVGEHNALWKWGIVAVVAGLVGIVAVGAWYLRSQRPADLAIKDNRPSASEPADSAAIGQKIVERVEGSVSREGRSEAPATPSDIVTPTPTSNSSDRIAADVPKQSGETNSVAVQERPPTSVVTTDRAAMLLAPPQDVAKPTVYVGHVSWSNSAPAPGQNGTQSVRADVDIPDLKMRATMLIRKNIDPDLPASHTIDLRLTFEEDSPFRGAKDVGVPQMRTDNPTGLIPLIGARVVINDGYFLIGLNRGDSDQQHNLDAISRSGWFDFPMLLPDGRIGKLTFEKGVDGGKLINSALNSWR